MRCRSAACLAAERTSTRLQRSLFISRLAKTDMASYISSNANRYYTALETSYGRVAAIEAGSRIPAVMLSIQQQVLAGTRQDKTGSRTFAGLPSGGRRRTSFELRTYLTSWSRVGTPAYGPLF